MTQPKTEEELVILEKEIKEFWSKFKTTCCNESLDQTLGLRDLWCESINQLSGKVYHFFTYLLSCC